MGSLTMSRVSAAAQVNSLSVFFSDCKYIKSCPGQAINVDCCIISYHVPQVKLTAKHLDSVVIEDSTFQVIFWKLSKTEGNYETIMKKFFNDKDDDTASRFFPGLVFSSTTPHQYWSQGIDDYS